MSSQVPGATGIRGILGLSPVRMRPLDQHEGAAGRAGGGIHLPSDA